MMHIRHGGAPAHGAAHVEWCWPARASRGILVARGMMVGTESNQLFRPSKRAGPAHDDWWDTVTCSAGHQQDASLAPVEGDRCELGRSWPLRDHGVQATPALPACFSSGSISLDSVVRFILSFHGYNEVSRIHVVYKLIKWYTIQTIFF